MFLHLSVSHSVHGGGVCLSECWDTPQAGTPWAGEPPPGKYTTPHPRAGAHPGRYTLIIHLLPPANEVCEGYVFTGVCLSTVVGGLPHCMLGHTIPRHTSPLGRPPPLCSACWDTVNKRAVCIPLECNLVFDLFLNLSHGFITSMVLS